jgi:hypothetical protein
VVRRADRGQGTAEYVGALAIVALVVDAGPGDAGGPGGGPSGVTGTGGTGGARPGRGIAYQPLGNPLEAPADPDDPLALDADEDDNDDAGGYNPGSDPEYDRQQADIQGRELWVRGYLNPRCVRSNFPCTSKWRGTFRPEYTAQAHAIRALSNLGGRRSWAERNIERDPVDNNVHWEVGPQKGGGWRIDILVQDPETGEVTILEVKRYRGPATTTTVDNQLTRYENNMDRLGVTVTRNNELNSRGWAVTYNEPPGLGESEGRQWYAWADPENPGHIYFAPADETPQDVRERAEEENPGFGERARENPIPIPIPVRPPVVVP